MALRDWLRDTSRAGRPLAEVACPDHRSAQNDEAFVVATATSATSATTPGVEHESVANVASVAVAAPENARRRASASERAELEELIGVILANDSASDRAEALAIAIVDPDAALVSFRALVAGLHPPQPKVSDDRRACTACANLVWNGECLAARRNSNLGVPGRSYFPVKDLPQRCIGFAPKGDDIDQRSAEERWPHL